MDGARELITSVSWAETGIGLLFYGFRVLTSVLYTRKFNPDFWIMSFTVMVQVSAQVFLQLALENGIGQHTAQVAPEHIVAASRWGWVYQYLSIVATASGKIAIIAFFLMLRRGTNKGTPWFLYALGGLLIAVNMSVIIVHLTRCDHMEKIWDPSSPGTCPRADASNDYAFFQASFNCVADAMLAICPILILRKLQLPLRTKVGLGILMGFGWIAVLWSAIKAYQLEVLLHTVDPLYDLHELLIWASTESWIVIIVGCVPGSRPIFEKMLSMVGISYNFLGTKASRSASGNKGSKVGGSSGKHQTGKSYRNRSQKNDSSGWIELSNKNSNNTGSTEKIVGGSSVLVTTVIETSHGDDYSEEDARYGHRIPEPDDVLHGRAHDAHKMV